MACEFIQMPVAGSPEDMITTRRPRIDVLLSCITLCTLALFLTVLGALRPTSSAAQEASPFPPTGQMYTYANGDHILTLEIEGSVLWAGTLAGGVVRWNTTNDSYVQYLRPQDGLAGNIVNDIAIDAHGQKWFATDHGLSVLDDNGTADKADDWWHTYTRQNTAGRLPGDRITAVAVDAAGDVWVGASQYWDAGTEGYAGGGLTKLETQGTPNSGDDVFLDTYTVANTITRVNDQVILGLASNNITSILPVADNQVWLATRRHWLFEDPDENFPGRWVLAHGGLSRLDHAGTASVDDDTWQTWNCEQDGQFGCVVTELRLDHLDFIWAASRGRGVLTFSRDATTIDPDRNRFTTDDGLESNFVDAIAFGPSDDPTWANTVWLSSYNSINGSGNGISILDHSGTPGNHADDKWNDVSPTSGNPITAADGLANNRVQALVLGNGVMWVGSGGTNGVAHGISPFKLSEKAFDNPLNTGMSGIPTNFISDIAFGESGTQWENQVWLGTGNRRARPYGVGALRLNTQGTLGTSDDTWTALTQTSTDNDGAAPWTGLASDNVTAVAIDGDNVWLGTREVTWDSARREFTDGGLSVFDGERWTIRTRDNSNLRLNSLTDVAVGCDGEVWVSLGNLQDNTGVGINVLDTGGNARNLSNDTWWNPFRYPPLPSDLITEIAPDCARRRMWVSSTPFFSGASIEGGGVGMYDYDAATEPWILYTKADGIQTYTSIGLMGEIQSVTVGSDEAVWIGAWGTTTLSYMDLIARWPYVPAVVNWLDGETWSAEVFDNDGWISSVAVDSAGNLWAGTSRGGMDVDHDGQPDNQEIDRATGGVKLSVDGSEWAIWSPDNSPLPTNDIQAIAIGPEGDVWLGTEGWGLLRFHPGEQTVTPTPTRGTPGSSSPTPTSDSSSSPTPTGTSGPPTTLTPTPSRTAVRPDVMQLFMPLVANNWVQGLVPIRTATYTPTSRVPTTATPTMTAVGPTLTPTVTRTPTIATTPTASAVPTDTLTPTVTPTSTQSPTPTVTPTPEPVPTGVWCPGSSAACRDVSLPQFPSKDLYDIQFVDSLNGFIIGEDGFLARTTDGGDTWTWETLASAAGATLRDIFMVNAQVGFIAGDNETLLRTTNGGNTFSSTPLPAGMAGHDEDFWAIAAFSADEAWALGNTEGTILYWNGTRWEFGVQGNWTGYPYTGLAMPAADQGWAVSGEGNIYRYNGAWTSAPAYPAAVPLYAIDMSSPTYGWAAGAGGGTVRYFNGQWAGATPISGLLAGDQVTGLHVKDSNDVWATALLGSGSQADTAIYHHSRNLWQRTTIVYGEQLRDIWVDDTLTNGWAVGNNGFVMRMVIPTDE